MSTANLNGTLLQLDQLLVAYTALLDEAKAQLTSLEVDSETVKKIAKEVATESDLKTDVRQAVIADFARSLREGDADLVDTWRGRQFTEMISKAVMATIRTEIESYVKGLLNEDEIKSALKDAVTSEIKSNNGMFEAYRLREFLRREIKDLSQD